MTVLQALAVLAAGIAAGAVNTIAGSGSLITFPTLLAVGYPPVVANVSNTVGLVPGGLSGVLGYRDQLRGQRRRAVRLGVASLLGGATGGVLLLQLPPGVFQAVVPVLILLACALMALQPRLARGARSRAAGHRSGGRGRLVAGAAGVALSGVYGGYFGAAQGILLLAILGVVLPDGLQRLNALKNVLGSLVNAVAALQFVVLADVAWDAAGLIAAGSIAGAQLGARVGRRLPEPVLRRVIVVAGSAVAVVLAVGGG